MDSEATIGGIIPDQTGQAIWDTRGIELAQQAVATNQFATYAEFETTTFKMIAGWGMVGYLFGALGWTWCFAAAGTWSRRLTWLSIATWGLFTLATISIFLPANIRPSSVVVSAGNAIAFVLLMLWFLWVADCVWGRVRPTCDHGRYAIWTHHGGRGIYPSTCNFLAGSHLIRACGERLPVVRFASDITNVVYINYLVDAKRLLGLVPPGLEIQRLGPGGRYAMFSILTYRHGHFGPAMLGPLRKLLSSPVQSNWRIYVTDPRTQTQGVYVVTNCIGLTLNALAARILSEGMPMHVPQQSVVERSADGSMLVKLQPGYGTAPDLHATFKPGERSLPHPWTDCFKDYTDFLAYCVPQDRALTSQPWYDQITRQEISLGIPLDACEPLTGEVQLLMASEILGDDIEPICFRVPSVSFRFLEQESYSASVSRR